jgi:hypothetical protein
LAWTRAEIGKKVKKSSDALPAITNDYAFGAVIWKGIIVLVVASAEHLPPNVLASSL